MYAPLLFSTSEKELHFVLFHSTKNEAYPLHWHDEVEISYVLKGTLKASINGDMIDVEEGDAVILAPGDHHYCQPSEAECLTVIFSPELLGGSPGSDVPNEFRQRLAGLSRTTGKWIPSDKERLAALLKELEETTEEPFFHELLVRSALFRLAALIADERVNAPHGMQAAAAATKVEERIGNVFRYIDAHYAEPLSLPEAAAASGYVPTYFSRVFKACTGMTFYDYLTLYRVRKAEMLLVGTKDSIQNVARESGFSSVKTFDRVFKEQTGYSPLKFRKQHADSHTGKRAR